MPHDLLRVRNKLRQHMIGGETHTSRLCFERIWVFDHDGEQDRDKGQQLCLSTGHGRPGKVKDAAERELQLELIRQRETERGLGELPSDHSAQSAPQDF